MQKPPTEMYLKDSQVFANHGFSVISRTIEMKSSLFVFRQKLLTNHHNIFPMAVIITETRAIIET